MKTIESIEEEVMEESTEDSETQEDRNLIPAY